MIVVIKDIPATEQQQQQQIMMLHTPCCSNERDHALASRGPDKVSLVYEICLSLFAPRLARSIERKFPSNFRWQHLCRKGEETFLFLRLAPRPPPPPMNMSSSSVNLVETCRRFVGNHAHRSSAQVSNFYSPLYVSAPFNSFKARPLTRRNVGFETGYFVSSFEHFQPARRPKLKFSELGFHL